MRNKSTLSDKVLSKIKNNPVLATLIVLGTVIIALSTFTDAVRKLLDVVPRGPKPPAADINGHWIAEATDAIPLIYFEFKVMDNELFGSVKLPPGPGMPQGRSGIINGQVNAHAISFSTKHEYIKEFGRYNFQTKERTPDTWSQVIGHYEGKIISPDEIYFTRTTDSGFFAEFVARKIVDKTVEFAPKNSEDYALLYTLPGNGKGVWSLSIGPEKGRLNTGGLRLASGSAENCEVSWWDLATAEFRGSARICSHFGKGRVSRLTHGIEITGSIQDDSKAEGGKGRVSLAYGPKKRDGIVYLQAVAVSEKGDKMMFRGWAFSENTISEGGALKEIQGAVSCMAISPDLRWIATGEIDESGKSSVRLRNSSGDIVRSLNSEGTVHAMGFSRDAALVAVAEAANRGKALLKIYSTATGNEKWTRFSQNRIGALAFSPDGKTLASGRAEDGQIDIWNLSTNNLRTTLPSDSSKGILRLLFNNNGDLLAAARHSSRLVELWDPSFFSLKQTIDNEEPVGDVVFSTDGRLLAVGGAEQGVIRLWGKGK